MSSPSPQKKQEYQQVYSGWMLISCTSYLRVPLLHLFISARRRLVEGSEEEMERRREVTSCKVAGQRLESRGWLHSKRNQLPKPRDEHCRFHYHPILLHNPIHRNILKKKAIYTPNVEALQVLLASILLLNSTDCPEERNYMQSIYA